MNIVCNRDVLVQERGGEHTHACRAFTQIGGRACHREWCAIALLILSRKEVMNHTLLFVVVVSIQVQIGSCSLSLSISHIHEHTHSRNHRGSE